VKQFVHGASALVILGSSIGCKGTLLPATYLHQEIAIQTAGIPGPGASPDVEQPNGANIPQVNGRPIRVYACQNAQTHRLYWAPEYRFQATDPTGAIGTNLPDDLTDSDAPVSIRVPPSGQSYVLSKDVGVRPTASRVPKDKNYEISGNYGIDVARIDPGQPLPVKPASAVSLPPYPSGFVRDRGLQACSVIESRSATAARGYERWGFVLAGIGAVGTASFGLTAVSTTAANDKNWGETAGLAAGAGLSALLTVLGGYLVARASDSWSAFGAADAAILQMQPNNSDGNAALCASAVQAWGTGRAAADAIGGGGGGGGGKGGGAAGGGGGQGASASASAAAPGPGPGGGQSSSSGGGANFPTCPSDLDVRAVETWNLQPASPKPFQECGPYAKAPGQCKVDATTKPPLTGVCMLGTCN
jgi:hypothetical protein